MSRSVLDAFMGLKGINPNFVDAWGQPARVTDENIRNLIVKLGFESADDSVLIKEYIEQEKRHWLSPLPPVSVFQKNSSYTFDVCLPIDCAAESLIYKINLEDGSECTETICATDFPLVATKEISDIEFQCYQITLNADLPFGYHSLSLSDPAIDEALSTMSLIVTPSRCYIPDAISRGDKIWGSSVQLYGVKSTTNWGIGDFSDLKTLLFKTKQNGGDFIGLNPIHALFPAHPEKASPYSPSSRKWLNILYTHITTVDEFAEDVALQDKVNSAAFKQKLNGLRDTEWVDYTAVAAVKISSLRSLFAVLNDGSVSSNKRLASFHQYIDDKGNH